MAQDVSVLGYTFARVQLAVGLQVHVERLAGLFVQE